MDKKESDLPIDDSDTPLATADITYLASDYTLTLSTFSDSVIFQFQDTQNNRVSGFSEPPVTINADTYLTEADLYGGVKGVVEEEGTDTAIAGPTLEIVGYNSAKPYYGVDNEVELIWSGFDGDPTIAFSPTTATVGGGYFTATVPGKYTVTASDMYSNTASVDITVCGYAGVDGSECWVLGSESTASVPGQNCSEVCNTVALTCDATATIINSEICSIFDSNYVTGTLSKPYAPLIQSTDECNSAESTISCTAVSQDIVPGVIHSSRICKCY